MYSSYIKTAVDFIHIMIIMAVPNRPHPGSLPPNVNEYKLFALKSAL